MSLWRSYSHHQNRHYHSGSPCCESPWTIHLHGRLQPIFYLTKWGYLLFTHTNTKTAKHKHPSARALVINFFFFSLSGNAHMETTHFKKRLPLMLFVFLNKKPYFTWKRSAQTSQYVLKNTTLTKKP